MGFDPVKAELELLTAIGLLIQAAQRRPEYPLDAPWVWFPSHGCACRELHTGTVWVPFCERPSDYPDTGAVESDPVSWRCPRCHGPVVQMFREFTEAGEPSRYVRELDGRALVEDAPCVRARYACRSAARGWREWVEWYGVEGERG